MLFVLKLKYVSGLSFTRNGDRRAEGSKEEGAAPCGVSQTQHIYLKVTERPRTHRQGDLQGNTGEYHR